MPADKLYNEGVFLLNQRQDYKDAAKKFEEVERQHPYSEWARKSLIMTAYSPNTRRATMTTRSPAARRYVTLHPGSPDAAYAQYLIGASYYDQIPDVTRDQARTDKAIAALEEVTRKYPGQRIRGERQAKDRGRARPARRQGDAGRPLLSGTQAISPARSTDSRSW